VTTGLRDERIFGLQHLKSQRLDVAGRLIQWLEFW
jgi:hypothetical protein